MKSSLLLQQWIAPRGENSFRTLGTAYERHASAVLRSIGLAMRQTGGKDDAGIDLQGVWHLSPSKSLSAIAQCKRVSRPCGPSIVRELEGVLTRQPEDAVAMLVSTMPASDAARTALLGSLHAMLFLQIVEDSDTALKQALGSRELTKRWPELLITCSRSANPWEQRPVFMYDGTLVSAV